MRRLLALTTLMAGLPFAASAFAEAPFSFASAPGELPKNVIPTAYVIDITTDLNRLSLRGKETISLDVASPSRSVTLNQAGLKLSSARLDNGMVAAIRQDDDAQTATLTFAQPVPAGHHTLAIDYTGPIIETPNGIYIDDYKSPDGKPRRMLVTQFEVADARRMFPGWDEPAFKATFQLNVTLPSKDVAVSNMPVTATTAAGPDAKRVSFQTTPRMSTYLLALVAGDMSAVHGNGDGTPIGVYAPTGLQEQGRYALGAAEKILPYYNTYFGTKYPLPKMDMIAIPGNYQAGAMENWGALTYIDNVLLFDPHNSTPHTRELIYEVVAHEMAHQWSGDLVTMGWWDNIWLNEGFASWMEIKATDKMNPDWDIWPRQHDAREHTMAMDALPTTHPIQQVIHNVSEANSAFDSISYGKGELVIRMLEGWLGEDTFRDGMRIYMKSHAYNNTTSQDLWDALARSSGQDVGRVARSFVEQPGIPQINVALTCQSGKGVYTLTQSRFAIHDPHPRALRWNVPVIAGGPGLETRKLVLGAQPATMTVPSCEAPLKFDLGESGYYRVHYDTRALAPLMKSFATFTPVDRANLLGDQYALFEAGEATLSVYLDLTSALPGENERDIAVLEDVIERLDTINDAERHQATRPAFQDFARRVLNPTMNRLGWDPKPGESVLDDMLRPSVIAELGELEDPSIIAEAQRRFKSWQTDPASLRANLVAPVTGVAARHADDATYDFLATKVRNAQSTEMKLRLFNALAHVTDPALIERNVELTYSGAIPDGRIAMTLSTIAAESGNPDLVWQLVKKHESEIRAHLAPWSQDGLLAGVARATSNPEIAEQLKNDPASQKTTGARIATARALDAIGARTAVAERIQTQTRQWLASHRD